MPDDKSVMKMQEAEEQLLAAYRESLELVKEAECATRCLAQLGFGISALLGGAPGSSGSTGLVWPCSILLMGKASRLHCWRTV